MLKSYSQIKQSAAASSAYADGSMRYHCTNGMVELFGDTS